MLNSGKPEWAMRIGTLVAIAVCALAIDAMVKVLARQAETASVSGGLTDPVEHRDEVGPVFAGRPR
jgi:hypothetical protein